MSPPRETSWSKTTLGKALPLRYGKARTHKAGVVREDSPVYGSSGVIDKFDRALTSGPALIIGRKGTVGATHYSSEPCWPIDTVYFAEASEEKDLRFFKHLLDHLQLGRMDRSTAVPGLSRDDYNAKEVAIPDIDEQRRIAAEIEKQFTRLEAGVVALRRVQANLKRYRAAVLKVACEGRLVPTEAELAKAENRKFETGEALLARILNDRRRNWQGRGKYKEPAAPDITKLSALSEGWTWASVDQLADETMIGLDRGRAQQSDDAATGVPYIKMNNVTMDGRVHCDELVFVPASREEVTRFAVQDRDILFNTRNSKELVGKVGLVRNPPAGAIYNNNLMRIRVPAGVSQAFLALQMCSHEFRQRMELVKKATTSVAAVYSKDLFPLAIALPPLAEQTRIVAEVERRLSVIEELESVVSTNLQRAMRLRQSVLQKAFTGKL